MDLKPGSRLKSAVCDTEIVVVKPPKGGAWLECGGTAMLGMSAQKPAGSISSAHADGSQLGKRYGDEVTGAEVLCTKPGAGSLSIDGRAMLAKEAKRLPSSD